MDDVKTGAPPVRQMIRQAIEALGGRATNVQVRDWVLQRYPGTNPLTIQATTLVCTVNHPSRVHYPEGKRERVANDPRYDFLYRPARGHLELYDPAQHGMWAIVKRDDGSFAVEAVGDGPDVAPSGESAPEVSPEFAAEAHLRDYLASNLALLEPGLSLYTDANGTSGVEYVTPMGRIDILAVDAQGGLVVVELKVSRGPDEVAGQLLRYRNWLIVNVARGSRVRAFIVAGAIHDRIRYALAGIPDVYLFEYEMALTMRKVETIALPEGLPVGDRPFPAK